MLEPAIPTKACRLELPPLGEEGLDPRTSTPEMTRPNQLRQYAQMDRSPLQHLDVHDGLESTLTIDAMDGRGILTVRTRRDGGSVLTA